MVSDSDTGAATIRTNKHFFAAARYTHIAKSAAIGPSRLHNPHIMFPERSGFVPSEYSQLNSTQVYLLQR